MPLNEKRNNGEIGVGKVVSELALIVTPEIRAAILKRIAARRKKVHSFGEELHANGAGEVDLGDIDETPPDSVI